MRVREHISCFLLLSTTLLVAQTKAPIPATDVLAKLAKDYAIEVVWKEPKFPVKLSTGVISGEAADALSVEAYARLFVPEFRLYPVELVRKTKLKRVVLCTTLAYSGQRRGAVPDWENDTMYYDVNAGRLFPKYQRSVVHHEFFHFIDQRDDGKVYEDRGWAKLNPEDFKYGAGGASAQNDPTTGNFTDKWPGFLNHYSTTGVEEDKAEIFAHLIVDAKYVLERAAKEPLLAKKIARMKELMAKFSPKVDAAFWKRAAELERDDKNPKEGEDEGKELELELKEQ